MNHEIEQYVVEAPGIEEERENRFSRTVKAATFALGMTIGVLGVADAAYAGDNHKHSEKTEQHSNKHDKKHEDAKKESKHEEKAESKTDKVDLDRFDCDDDRMWEAYRPEKKDELDKANHDNLELDKNGKARFEWKDWDAGTKLTARLCADDGTLIEERVFAQPEKDNSKVWKDGPKDRAMLHMNFDLPKSKTVRLAVFSDDKGTGHNDSKPLFDMSDKVRVPGTPVTTTTTEKPKPVTTTTTTRPQEVVAVPQRVIEKPHLLPAPTTTTTEKPHPVETTTTTTTTIPTPEVQVVHPKKEMPKTGREIDDMVRVGGLLALGGLGLRQFRRR